MRRVLQTFGVLVLLGAVAGGSIVFLGLYNVSARAGHLPGVSWLLHTTYRNSVELRAPPASEVPDLADEDLIALGARHFDGACRFCHSAPGFAQAATAESMMPEPPHVTDAVKRWEPRHLHWIVHEGVKMSGMPAWPATRSDEVWPVVAFLAAVPGMEQARYAELVAPPGDGAEAEPLAYCASCHGVDGRAGGNDHIPRLDIQTREYLLSSLQAYREGTRDSGIMRHAATVVGTEALPTLAEHYARQPAAPGEQGAPPADLVERGRALATAATNDPDVPACMACHGPDGGRAQPDFPVLAGQHRAYLETQLQLWRRGLRGGGPRSQLMHKAAQDLTDDNIVALAAYYTSLPPGGRETDGAE